MRFRSLGRAKATLTCVAGEILCSTIGGENYLRLPVVRANSGVRRITTVIGVYYTISVSVAGLELSVSWTVHLSASRRSGPYDYSRVVAQRLSVCLLRANNYEQLGTSLS